ncbi:MAG: DUF393 domain-containing protein [Pseudomonadota bacterium]
MTPLHIELRPHYFPSMNDKPKTLEVFYDGGCPICRFEVNLYDKHDKADVIDWVDIEDLSDVQLPKDKSRDDLLGKFHVRDETGWHIGVDAFARIWRSLPVWRRFAFIFSVPGIRQLAEIGYRLFLKWQGWHRKSRRSDESTATG